MTAVDGDTEGFRVSAGSSGLAIFGEVDAATAHLLEGALSAVAGGLDGTDELVVDCRGLEFIDSSGLNVLVATARRLAGHDVRLVLESPHPATRRLFEITGLDQVVTIRQ